MPMTGSANPISVLCIIGSCISLQVGAALAIHLFDDGGTWGTTAVRLLVAGTILLLFSRPRIREWDRRSTRRVEPGQFHRNPVVRCRNRNSGFVGAVFARINCPAWASAQRLFPS